MRRCQSELNRIQRKGASDIRNLLDDSSTAAMLIACRFDGRQQRFRIGRKVLHRASESVRVALDELKDLAAMIKTRYPQVDLRIDVSELSDTAITTALSSPSIIRSMAARWPRVGATMELEKYLVVAERRQVLI